MAPARRYCRDRVGVVGSYFLVATRGGEDEESGSSGRGDNKFPLHGAAEEKKKKTKKGVLGSLRLRN